MNSQKSVIDFKDYQILYLVDIHKGSKASQIADMPGITVGKVFKTVEKYSGQGVNWKSGKGRGGRREERCTMSLDAERDFLKSVEEEAFAGQIITYRQVKSKLEARPGREISDGYVRDMFKRHGWKKKVPRKSHPQAGKAAREEYKKTPRITGFQTVKV